MAKLAIVLMAALIAVTLANPRHSKILSKIKHINSIQNLWTAGYNEMSALPKSEFKRKLGAKILEKNLNVQVKNIKTADDIPDSFDSREKWSQCPSISSIKDQGDCGGCWAVATASAASDRQCIGTNYSISLNLSAENLLTCCILCSEARGGCNGGDPLDAWEYLVDIGIVTGGDYDSGEGCQPYGIYPSGVALRSYTPPCLIECTNDNYTVPYFDDFYYGDVAYLLPKNVEKIQSDILGNGPLVATFTVYDDFQYYKSGVYVRTSDKKDGRHAVRVLGWGIENGTDYWLVANSWNRTWGDNGLFKIRRGTDECDFEDYVTAGLLSGM